jgi:hypothetical protein
MAGVAVAEAEVEAADARVEVVRKDGEGREGE